MSIYKGNPPWAAPQPLSRKKAVTVKRMSRKGPISSCTTCKSNLASNGDSASGIQAIWTSTPLHKAERFQATRVRQSATTATYRWPNACAPFSFDFRSRDAGGSGYKKMSIADQCCRASKLRIYVGGASGQLFFTAPKTCFATFFPHFKGSFSTFPRPSFHV